MPFKPKKDRKKPEAAGTVNEVVSISDTPPDAVERLLRENAELKAQLAVANTARGAAEQAALDAAQAQGSLLQPGIQEVPSGKSITVKRLDFYKVVGHGDGGREIRRPVFKDVQLPTFFYKIDIPPVGGTDCKINEIPYYHGTVYELDIDTLRTVKEMVYRLWDHDRNIHGSDENAYRQQKSPRISGRAMA